MITTKPQQHWLNQELFLKASLDALVKFNPLYMVKNPVMFVVEIGMVITIALSMFPELFAALGGDLQVYNIVVSLILFITIYFANLAEALAEGRGKAQANALKSTQKDTMARLVSSQGQESIVPSSSLKKGDIVLVRANEVIPSDGEIIEGVASVDESAITGESAPVLKEAGGDFSSVTGGTTVISDWIKIRITVNAGESFLDKMILLVEGSKREKTPNEVALSILLIGLTVVFLIVIITLYPMALYSGIKLSVSTLVALAVCLIPTTIGGLLSAIGIAGMDRVTRFNVIAMSGKAVEACGDVDVMILDKTGTITYGNRMAHKFLPIGGTSDKELIKAALLSSLSDMTPEGKSIVTLARELLAPSEIPQIKNSVSIEFSANTKMSGINLANGVIIRKGASSAVMAHVSALWGKIPSDLEEKVKWVSEQGGTPLVVSQDDKILGVIYLKDTIKPGLVERFQRLRAIGIKTIMCTGDNPITAASIAQEAGVDTFIAECKPEDKIKAIQAEKKLGKVVAMTGDGTNDAPALAQADIGIAMNSGTAAAKEAANMIDLDSDPTKILDIVEIGKQLLMTRGALTTFSIANDVAKYFAIIPAILLPLTPQMQQLNVMGLATPNSAILSALIFNALIIPCLIPIAMKGVAYQPKSSEKILAHNMLIYGMGGILVPFAGIKAIDIAISPLLRLMGL